MIVFPETPILDYFAWKLGITPVIPKFYWDAYSQEEIIKELCKELDSIAKYSEYLGTEMNVDRTTINQIAETLNQLQDGGWFEEYSDIIEAWIRDIDNIEGIVADVLNDTQIPDRVTALEGAVGDNSDDITALQTALGNEVTDRGNADTALGNRIDALETEAEGWTADIESVSRQTHPAVMLNIIAHRGAQRTAPENTLLAMRHAKRFFYDYVEFDIRPTLDNGIVCAHDSDISHYTDGVGNIETMTTAAVQSFPITKGLGIDNIPITLPQQRIPTLTEMLDTLKSLDFKRIMVDFKVTSGLTDWTEDLMDTVIREVELRGMQNVVIYGSFTSSVINYLHIVRPDAYLVQHLSGTPSQTTLEAIKNRGASGFSYAVTGGSTWTNIGRNLGLDAFISGLGAENDYYNVKQWGVAAIYCDTLGFLPRTTNSNCITAFGLLNDFGGGMYPAPAEFFKRQGDKNGFMPAYRVEPNSSASYTLGAFESMPFPMPYYDGQAQQCSTAPIKLEIGTIVHFDNLNNTYQFVMRIWDEDFGMFYSGDGNAWQTESGDYIVAASDEMNVSAQDVPRPVWVTFTAQPQSGRAVSELDCVVLDRCITWSSQRSSLMLYSTADGVVNGYGYRGVMEPVRLWSGIFPTAQNATIPVPTEPDEYSVHVYVYGANGKRIRDSGALTSDYTVTDANAAYARYVFMMANAAQYISPRVWGKIHNTYKIICSPVM